MRPAELPDLAPWGLGAPSTVERPADGSNNSVWLLDGRWVLRRYETLGREQVEAEHRLLAALADRTDLPFAVPAPIPTADGATFVQQAGGQPVALSPLIVGRHPRLEDLRSVELAAEALGLLDRVLADLPASLAPRDGRVPLDRLHPAVDDVADLADELDRALPGDDGVAWLRAHAEPSEAAYAGLVTSLPCQIVHGDLSLSNVLVDGGRVTGVLDFDHAYYGLRVEDPVAAAFMAAWFRTQGGRRRLAAFGRGYARTGRLSPAEDAAVAVLLRRRALGSVVWSAGSWRRGLGTLDDVREHLAVGLVLEELLASGEPIGLLEE